MCCAGLRPGGRRKPFRRCFSAQMEKALGQLTQHVAAGKLKIAARSNAA